MAGTLNGLGRMNQHCSLVVFVCTYPYRNVVTFASGVEGCLLKLCSKYIFPPSLPELIPSLKAPSLGTAAAREATAWRLKIAIDFTIFIAVLLYHEDVLDIQKTTCKTRCK
jgi:hypothetical protein